MSEMEKYGVDENSDEEKGQNKTAEKNEEGCPNCGKPVAIHGKVRVCPNCGTKPFEDKGEA